MKLKNYKEIFEEVDPKDWDDWNEEEDDQLYGRPSYQSKSIHSGYDPDAVDELPDDDMQHLLYLLRSLFKQSGISASVENKNLDIIIYVILNKREKLKTIISVFNVAKKLKKDILAQYDSEFEIWQTKGGDPMLTFNFTYGDGDGDDNEAF